MPSTVKSIPFTMDDLPTVVVPEAELDTWFQQHAHAVADTPHNRNLRRHVYQLRAAGWRRPMDACAEKTLCHGLPPGCRRDGPGETGYALRRVVKWYRSPVPEVGVEALYRLAFLQWRRSRPKQPVSSYLRALLARPREELEALLVLEALET